ncbi:MAG: hypothetical protein HYV09_33265 [Deltaproteobacteria bacterium]|nr:hypothetical protein [Deltaproteobacteria bacterium]
MRAPPLLPSRLVLVPLLVLGTFGCSSDTIAEVPEGDAAVFDTADDGDASADTAVAPDTGTPADATPDTVVADTGAKDTAVVVDTNVPETSGVLFPCGSGTCSSTLQFCRRATSPGICPAPDSGVCPAGCPGCPPLGVSCETMPTKCWAKASCACILVEVCGSSSAGTCEEKDGGFTVGCMGA